MAGKLLALGFFGLVVWLLTNRLQDIDWNEVGVALRRLEPGLLGLAIGLTALSYCLHASFDLVSRAYTHHRLPVGLTYAIAFVTYTFNMSLGGLVGGTGFRYRLYSQFGLGVGQITRILGTSVLTNWLGYVLVAGLVFSLGLLPLPANVRVGESALRAVGVVFLMLVATYLSICCFARRRVWTIHRLHLRLPSWRMALTQLGLSTLSWLVVAAVLYAVLPQLGYGRLIAVLMAASTIGAMTHVPGNLGVTEAVFLTFCSSLMPQGELLAGLIAYRAVYYLAPLSVGVVAYITLEARARRNRRAVEAVTRAAETFPASPPQTAPRARP